MRLKERTTDKREGFPDMCDICKGDGLKSYHGYYASFEPCPNPECRERAKAKALNDLADLQLRFGIELGEIA